MGVVVYIAMKPQICDDSSLEALRLNLRANGVAMVFIELPSVQKQTDLSVIAGMVTHRV